MDERFTDSSGCRPSAKVGARSSRLWDKRGGEGAGLVAFGLKIRGAGPSPGSGTNRKCSIHKVKAAKLDACVKSKQTNRKKQVGLIYKNSCEVYLNLIKLKIRDLWLKTGIRRKEKRTRRKAWIWKSCSTKWWYFRRKLCQWKTTLEG